MGGIQSDLLSTHLLVHIFKIYHYSATVVEIVTGRLRPVTVFIEEPEGDTGFVVVGQFHNQVLIAGQVNPPVVTPPAKTPLAGD